MKQETKSKWKEFVKQAKNPAPERIYQLNMQANIMQGIGTSAVCLILMFTGLWWIIFAFVFTLIQNYTGYVTNRSQYNIVMMAKRMQEGEKDVYKEIEQEISPSRRKIKIIKKQLGRWPTFVSIILTGLWAALIYQINYLWWYENFWTKFALALTLFFGCLFIYIFIYFVCFYGIANKFYKKDLKNWKEVKEKCEEKMQ